MNYTEEQLDEIRVQSAQSLETEPRIERASFEDGVLTIALFGDAVPQGVTVSVPTASLTDLSGATASQLAAMQVTKTGNALHWPELDVQMSTIALLEILTGLQTFKSAQRKGGLARTPAKRASSRANGALGGRPRKQPQTALT